MKNRNSEAFKENTAGYLVTRSAVERNLNQRQAWYQWASSGGFGIPPAVPASCLGCLHFLSAIAKFLQTPVSHGKTGHCPLFFVNGQILITYILLCAYLYMVNCTLVWYKLHPVVIPNFAWTILRSSSIKWNVKKKTINSNSASGDGIQV